MALMVNRSMRNLPPLLAVDCSSIFVNFMFEKKIFLFKSYGFSIYIILKLVYFWLKVSQAFGFTIITTRDVVYQLKKLIK